MIPDPIAMRFQGISLDVTRSFQNSPENPTPWAPFTGFATVISYHLSTWIKGQRLDVPQATGLMIYLVQPHVGDKTHWWDNTFCVTLTTPTAAEMKALATPADVFDTLLRATATGIDRAAAALDLDANAFKRRLWQLPECNHMVTHLLHTRRPRGLGLQMSFEARMTRHALDVDFVIHDTKGERYRETVQTSVPSPLALAKRFRRIDLTDGIVSTPGRLMRPGQTLGTADIAYYHWSRALSDMI